jgi:hypothetical protein
VITREQALIDPIGVVVDLVGTVDTGLTADAVAAVVTAVAGGRAKRRRLAAALLDNPSILTTGRSPAPSAVGDLLLALRRGGAAAGISAPYCAGCGRTLTSIQRRGEDWYCSACFTRPEPCASCGHPRYVASRDRQGQPRCGQCPDEDSRDPLVALVTAIRAVDASLPAATVTEVVQRTVSKPGHWLRLAWIIEDNSALLTGDGCQAPVPALLRLIDALRAAGAAGVVRPACPLCRRVMALSKKKDGQRICRACSARDRAVRPVGGAHAHSASPSAGRAGNAGPVASTVDAAPRYGRGRSTRRCAGRAPCPIPASGAAAHRAARPSG